MPWTPKSSQREVVEHCLELEASASLLRENRRVFTFALCVVAFLLLAHFTPLESWLKSGQRWKRTFDEFGFAAHLALLIATAVAVMMGMPRLPLCSVAGAAFGFGERLVVSWLGSALGSYGTFLLARWGASLSGPPSRMLAVVACDARRTALVARHFRAAASCARHRA